MSSGIFGKNKKSETVTSRVLFPTPYVFAIGSLKNMVFDDAQDASLDK